ncbi:hypothetical protein [Streptomyces sp. NPDC059631]|uniref:hypothetical protein n=1 Tax=unclassified Streptomyces TaxID=2593676 RepID=UPI0036C04449
MTKAGNNALKQEARALAALEGISYTTALRRLIEVSNEHADRPCPPDCPTKESVLVNAGEPWEGACCPVHQPDYVAGWELEGAYPRARREFLTNGGVDGPLFGEESHWTGDCQKDAPELAAFFQRLSPVGQVEFARTWKNAFDTEAAGVELILHLRQADESQLVQMVHAMEREAIRKEMRGALGGDETGFEEIGFDEFTEPARSDHSEEIDHLIDVIETSTALLAMLLNHQRLTMKSMEQGRFAELVRQHHRATAQDVFTAAGWELRSASDSGDE